MQAMLDEVNSAIVRAGQAVQVPRIKDLNAADLSALWQAMRPPSQSGDGHHTLPPVDATRKASLPAVDKSAKYAISKAALGLGSQYSADQVS